MTLNLGVNIIRRQMTPFFPSNLWFLSLGITSFLIFSTFKIDFHGFLPGLKKNTLLNAKNHTFKPVNKDIYFLHKFANFWYIKCFAPNLKPIWPRSYGLKIFMSVKICRDIYVGLIYNLYGGTRVENLKTFNFWKSTFISL